MAGFRGGCIGLILACIVITSHGHEAIRDIESQVKALEQKLTDIKLELSEAVRQEEMIENNLSPFTPRQHSMDKGKAVSESRHVKHALHVMKMNLNLMSRRLETLETGRQKQDHELEKLRQEVSGQREEIFVLKNQLNRSKNTLRPEGSYPNDTESMGDVNTTENDTSLQPCACVHLFEKLKLQVSDQQEHFQNQLSVLENELNRTMVSTEQTERGTHLSDNRSVHNNTTKNDNSIRLCECVHLLDILKLEVSDQRKHFKEEISLLQTELYNMNISLLQSENETAVNDRGVMHAGRMTKNNCSQERCASEHLLGILKQEVSDQRDYFKKQISFLHNELNETRVRTEQSEVRTSFNETALTLDDNVTKNHSSEERRAFEYLLGKLKQEMSDQGEHFREQLALLQNELNITKMELWSDEGTQFNNTDVVSTGESARNLSCVENCLCRHTSDNCSETAFNRRLDSLKNDTRSFNDGLTEIRKGYIKIYKKCRKATTKNKKLIIKVVSELQTKMFLDILDNANTVAQSLVRMRKDFNVKLRGVKQQCKCSNPKIQPGPTTVVVPTTTTPVPKRNHRLKRILIVPRLSHTVSTTYQLHLHTNNVKVYPYWNISNVASAAYDPTSRRIIYSRYSPDGIFSTRLDRPRVRTIRENVKTYGMAVDGQRKVLFLTTYHPKYSISRMTTHGKHFRGIVDLHDSYKPFGISVDSVRKLVYFCAFDRLSVVNYDGNNIRTLETEMTGLYAVAVDAVTNNLYFSSYQKIMWMSLSTGNITEIMELNNDLWKIVFYDNNLYTSSYNGSDIDVIYLGNNVHYHLKKMPYKNNDIVLIP